MKTDKFKTIVTAATIALAAVFTTSCDLINKATETDIEVGDFSFTVDVEAAGATRAGEGGNGTHFAGSQTITRARLLDGVAEFDYDLIRRVKLEGVAIDIEQSIGEVGIESLTLACEGVASVEITDAPLASVAAAKQEALKTFASAIIKKIIVDGEATVSLDATFDAPVSADTVSWLIALSEITLVAGLNL